MSKNQILAIVAATLLGAFWVYPSIERTQRPVHQQNRGPASVQTKAEPIARPIQRKQTTIKPMRMHAKKIAAKKKLNSTKLAKAPRVSFGSKSDRRPTSLPMKKIRPKRDNFVRAESHEKTI